MSGDDEQGYGDGRKAVVKASKSAAGTGLRGAIALTTSEVTVYASDALEEEFDVHASTFKGNITRLSTDEEAHEELLELSKDLLEDLNEGTIEAQQDVVTCGNQYRDAYNILKQLWDDFHDASHATSFAMPSPPFLDAPSGTPRFTHLSYFHRFPVDVKASLKKNDGAPPSEYEDMWFHVDETDDTAAAHEANWIMLNLSYQINEVMRPGAVGLSEKSLDRVAKGDSNQLTWILLPRSRWSATSYDFSNTYSAGLMRERPGGSGTRAGSASVYNQLKWQDTWEARSNHLVEESIAAETLEEFEASGETSQGDGYPPQHPFETYPRNANSMIATGADGAPVSVTSTYGLNSLGGHGTEANKRYNLPHLPNELRDIADDSEFKKAFPNEARAMEILANRMDGPIERMLAAAECINEAAEDVDKIYEDWVDDLKDMKEDEKDSSWYEWEDDLLLANLAHLLKNVDLLPTTADIGEIMAQHKDPSRIFFREQCYLLSYIRQFSLARKDRQADISRNNSAFIKHRDSAPPGLPPPPPGAHETALSPDDWNTFVPPSKVLPYYTGNKPIYEGNACCIVDGDPYALLNKLVMDKRQQAYMNISNDKLSYLQPKIRLFKVAYDDEGKEENIEVKFDTHFSQTDMSAYMTYGQRGAGVGVKSFDFTYDGSNPFSAKKSIKAKLKIFANTFDDLVLCRGAAKCDDPSDDAYFKSYRYIDLALKTSSPRSKTATNEEKCEAALARTERLRENIELQKLNFRLKAHVGIEVPQNQELSKNLTTKELSELAIALNCSCVTLNLTPTVHTFDLDEQGRVIFEINYLAYVEDFYDHAAFNIFANPQISLKRIVRNSQMEAAEKACEYDELDELKEDAAIESAKEFRTLLTTLIDNLILEGKMQYFSVDQGQLQLFLVRGAYSDADLDYSRGVWAGFQQQNDDMFATTQYVESPIMTSVEYADQLQKNLDSTMDIFVKSRSDDEMEDEDKKIALALNNDYKTTIPFFYIADLIDIALKNIEGEVTELPELINNFMAAAPNDAYDCLLRQHVYNAKRYQETFKKFRVVLGPVEFVGVKSASKSAFVNLGDVPMSAKYFIEWMTSKFLKKNEMVYSLSQFLNDIINNLVNQFLNGTKCPVAGTSQNVRLNQSTITGQAVTDPTEAVQSLIKADVPLDVFTNHALTTGFMRFDAGKWTSPQPILNPSGFSGASARTTIPADEEINYMVYFVGRTMPTEQMKGNKAEDEAKGVYHYLLGRDRGLVKSIKLQKTATPGLAEVRFEQEGYDGLEQLRVVYDVEIESYANVNTFPGTYIYIEPAGFSPSAKLQNIDLTKFGIGGYYMIIKSSHTFLAGQLKSTITAKWVNQLEGEEAVAIREEKDEDAAKCAQAQTRAELASESIEEFLEEEAIPPHLRR